MASVQIAPGVALDDLWAGRMVDHMLADLHARVGALQRSFAGVSQRSSSVCGSPKAQLRLYDRLSEALGPALIGRAIKTGKRGDFSMLFQFWDALPLVGETRPTRLVAFTMIIQGRKGRGYEVEAIDVLFTIARHALVRGLQRGGARQAEDLVRILRELHHCAMLARLAGQKKAMPGEGSRGWLMPFKGPDGRRLFAVVIGTRPTPVREVATFVPTLLAEHQVIQGPALDLLQATMAENWSDPTAAQILELHATLEATRPLFKAF